MFLKVPYTAGSARSAFNPAANRRFKLGGCQSKPRYDTFCRTSPEVADRYALLCRWRQDRSVRRFECCPILKETAQAELVNDIRFHTRGPQFVIVLHTPTVILLEPGWNVIQLAIQSGHERQKYLLFALPSGCGRSHVVLENK